MNYSQWAAAGCWDVMTGKRCHERGPQGSFQLHFLGFFFQNNFWPSVLIGCASYWICNTRNPCDIFNMNAPTWDPNCLFSRIATSRCFKTQSGDGMTITCRRLAYLPWSINPSAIICTFLLMTQCTSNDATLVKRIICCTNLLYREA